MVLFRKAKKSVQPSKVAQVPDTQQEVARPLSAAAIPAEGLETRGISSKQSGFGERGGSGLAWLVLKSPKVSEKATKLIDQRQYIFVVTKDSTKPEVKKAVEEVYRVRVERVNIVRIKGKRKQWRRQMAKLPDIKKAIVTLREGEKIEIT